MNLFLAFFLVFLAAIALLPVYGTLKYDGIADILDWPWIFYVFLAVGLTLAFLALRLLFTRQRVGAEIAFHEGGFDLDVRRFFRRDLKYRLAWSEIEEMKLVKAPRGGDYIAFRLSHKAAVDHGLIEPTTRHNASKKLVKREIPFPPKLSGVSANEAITRFHASAVQAGVKLVETASLNVVVFERKVWSVQHD